MPAGEHVLTTHTFIPRPRSEVFAFFAAAENLDRITPPELNFHTVSPTPVRMAKGAVIDYELRLFGVRIRWKALISEWQPETRFVDEQLKGPYAMWVHTHTFRDEAGGTDVGDEVRYRLPFFPVGECAYPLVRLQLGRIFSFRAKQLGELLG